MRMKHLIYASIITSVPFFAGIASAQGASAEPTLWGIYGAHNRHDPLALFTAGSIDLAIALSSLLRLAGFPVF